MSNRTSVVLIDLNCFIFRFYFASFSSNTPSRKYIYKRLLSLLTYLTTIHDDSSTVILIQDGPKYKARSQRAYEYYKSNRPSLKDLELYRCLRLVGRVVAKFFSVSRIKIKWFEADAVIKALVDRFKATHEIFIISNDSDMYQFIDPVVTVMHYYTGEWIIMNNQAFIDKFNFNPIQYIEYKALVGDKSDNIPGITGIGPKKAQYIILEYTTVKSFLYSYKQKDQALYILISDNYRSFLLFKGLISLSMHYDYLKKKIGLVYNKLIPFVNRGIIQKYYEQ